MNDKNNQQPPPAPSIVDDKAAENLTKHLKDWGLIVNAGADKKGRPSTRRGSKKGSKK